MWQFLLLAAVGAGTGFLAKCVKHNNREEPMHVEEKIEERTSTVSEPCISNKSINADVVGGKYDQHQGMWFSYGVGVGAMFMICSGKCELDKLTALVNQIAGSVEELKRQSDARNDYEQNDEMQEGVYHPEFPLQIDAKCPINDESCFVGTPYEENESERSVITFECAQQGSRMAELEEELQAELAHIEVDLFKSSSSKHQRSTSGYSESSIAVVEGGLCIDGLPGHYSSSENETAEVPLDVSYGNDYGVSPYELDRHLRDLVEKQQEENILELEIKLKSMELNLRAKERELQQWKDRVRYLAEHSFGVTTSGEDSSTVTTEDKNLLGISNCSFKSNVSSAQKGVSLSQWWPHDQCIEGPLESTAESPDQFDYRGKLAANCTGLTMLAHVEGKEQTRSVCNLRDSLDRHYIDFLNGLVDVGSSTCHNESDGSFTKSIDQRSCEMFDKVSEASSCCTLLDHS